MSARGAEGAGGPPMPPPPAVYQMPPPPHCPPGPPAGYHPGSQDDARVAYMYQRSHDPEYQAGVMRWSTGDDSAIGARGLYDHHRGASMPPPEPGIGDHQMKAPPLLKWKVPSAASRPHRRQRRGHAGGGAMTGGDDVRAERTMTLLRWCVPVTQPLSLCVWGVTRRIKRHFL
ncbi:hypothetical protein FJT64_013627 [Amphibalanus amphitrite]|uniref:Uncharacterized protein n=1 Tax=Amphibalanus amphitrite TaxID=1232801 RepID=A0A6A4VCB7_AMPAM|nr:hypothetical protein FJT64_013627 [Amphibalanus amphitrite]